MIDKIMFNDTAVTALSAYLPVLREIWEEAARDRLFPSADTRHQPRPAVSDEIYRRLASERCLTIGGIAGSGKSEAAAAYGAAHRQDYDLQIWLDGKEICRVDDLAATSLMRGQEKRNIASLMRTRRCLLVIDDPHTTLENVALAALCGPDSHVLITIRKIRPGVYEMSLMSIEEGRAILNADVATPCPQGTFDIIWATVGGHPLSLALMNGTARDGASWRDIQDDCLAVGELSDPKQRLADRLLLRSRDLLQTPLSVFEWAGQPDCDTGFLRFAIHPVGLRNLNTHALTAADRDSITRLHDVVFSSLSSLDWWTLGGHNELDDKLAAYLEAASNRNDLSLWSVAGNLRSRLMTLVTARDVRPTFLLALLVAWTPEEVDPSLLGDPVARAAELAAIGNQIAPIEFRVLIETIEQLYLRTKPQGRAAVTTFLEASLPVFDSLASLPGLTQREVAEIHHHRGKVYRWLHRDVDARCEFETVMRGPSPLDATRLQLIRLYKFGNEFTAAADLGEAVLNSAEQSGEVTPSVLLAVIQDLPWREASVRERLLWPKQVFIEQTIISYANAGYDQAYRTLAAVARWWSQEAPDVLARVLLAIPTPSAAHIHDDEDRFAFGDVFLEASRAPDVNVGKYQALALSFFEAQVHPKDFHTQRQAELLIDMGRAQEAEALLRAHRQFDSSCWIHRLMARARFAQDDASEALAWIDRALADEKGSARRDEFLELRYEIRRALGHPEAVEVASEF